jgi:hypothetical protein
MLSKDEKRKIILENSNLSWKAKGLACVILDNEEMFADVNVKDKVALLEKIGTEAYCAIHAGLNELVKNGLMTKKRVRTGNVWQNAFQSISWHLTIPENKSEETSKEAAGATEPVEAPTAPEVPAAIQAAARVQRRRMAPASPG